MIINNQLAEVFRENVTSRERKEIADRCGLHENTIFNFVKKEGRPTRYREIYKRIIDELIHYSRRNIENKIKSVQSQKDTLERASVGMKTLK